MPTWTFFNCSIYIYIRKHFHWQCWLSLPVSHPLSPAPTCTLAFWPITSTITDYSTERAVTPPPSTSPHSHPPLTQADTVTSRWPFVFSTVVPVNCVNSVTAHMMRKKRLFLIIAFYVRGEGLCWENTFGPHGFVRTCCVYNGMGSAALGGWGSLLVSFCTGVCAPVDWVQYRAKIMNNAWQYLEAVRQCFYLFIYWWGGADRVVI